MSDKVLLVLCDGMRPDAVKQVNHPFFNRICSEGAVTMNARTVMPSVTLPCHMSLFTSVEPNRHGVLTNTYVPQVRPIDGMCEQFSKYEKTCAMFYNWEELKDLTRPQSMIHTAFYNNHYFTDKGAHDLTVEDALRFIPEVKPDFNFLYLGMTDEIGHRYGWMGKEYLEAVKDCFDGIEKVYSKLGDEYSVIIIADHGGHDRSHGTDMPEDMTIPVLAMGKPFSAGRDLGSVSIMDIAPTIAKILGVPSNGDWEGKAFI